MNFTELQANVQSALGGRSDIPEYVYELITASLNRDLRTLDMQAELAFEISEEITSLPADYLDFESIYLDLNPRIPLVNLSTNSVDYTRRDSGTPWGYAISNSKVDSLPQIGVIPTPDGAYSVISRYYQKLLSLTDSVQSNVVLERYPSLYMYGGAYQAAVWAQDETLAGGYKALYDGAMAETKSSETRRKYAGPMFQRSGRDMTW